MNEAKNDDKGFTCECGVEHVYPSYVYAHWTLDLVFKCECERSYDILEGTASLRKQGESDFERQD